MRTSPLWRLRHVSNIYVQSAGSTASTPQREPESSAGGSFPQWLTSQKDFSSSKERAGHFWGPTQAQDRVKPPEAPPAPGPSQQENSATADEANAYCCERCGKTFARKSDLTRHTRARSCDRLYMCQFLGCGQRFIDTTDLRAHEQKHLSPQAEPAVKPAAPAAAASVYRDCPCCSTARNLTPESLKFHLIVHRIHDGLSCRFCGKNFGKSNELLRHVTIHTDEKPVKRPPCPMQLADDTKVKNHVLLRHPSDVSRDKDCKKIESAGDFRTEDKKNNQTASATESNVKRATGSGVRNGLEDINSSGNSGGNQRAARSTSRSAPVLGTSTVSSSTQVRGVPPPHPGTGKPHVTTAEAESPVRQLAHVASSILQNNFPAPERTSSDRPQNAAADGNLDGKMCYRQVSDAISEQLQPAVPRRGFSAVPAEQCAGAALRGETTLLRQVVVTPGQNMDAQVREIMRQLLKITKQRGQLSVANERRLPNDDPGPVLRRAVPGEKSCSGSVTAASEARPVSKCGRGKNIGAAHPSTQDDERGSSTTASEARPASKCGRGENIGAAHPSTQDDERGSSTTASEARPASKCGRGENIGAAQPSTQDASNQSTRERFAPQTAARPEASQQRAASQGTVGGEGCSPKKLKMQQYYKPKEGSFQPKGILKKKSPDASVLLTAAQAHEASLASPDRSAQSADCSPPVGRVKRRGERSRPSPVQPRPSTAPARPLHVLATCTATHPAHVTITLISPRQSAAPQMNGQTAAVANAANLVAYPGAPSGPRLPAQHRMPQVVRPVRWPQERLSLPVSAVPSRAPAVHLASMQAPNGCGPIQFNQPSGPVFGPATVRALPQVPRGVLPTGPQARVRHPSAPLQYVTNVPLISGSQNQPVVCGPAGVSQRILFGTGTQGQILRMPPGAHAAGNPARDSNLHGKQGPFQQHRPTVGGIVGTAHSKTGQHSMSASRGQIQGPYAQPPPGSLLAATPATNNSRVPEYSPNSSASPHLQELRIPVYHFSPGNVCGQLCSVKTAQEPFPVVFHVSNPARCKSDSAVHSAAGPRPEPRSTSSAGCLTVKEPHQATDTPASTNTGERAGFQAANRLMKSEAGRSACRDGACGQHTARRSHAEYQIGSEKPVACLPQAGRGQQAGITRTSQDVSKPSEKRKPSETAENARKKFRFDAFWLICTHMCIFVGEFFQILSEALILLWNLCSGTSYYPSLVKLIHWIASSMVCLYILSGVSKM